MIEFVKEINCFETMFKQHYLKVSYQYYDTITTISSLHDQYIIEVQLNQAIDDDVWMELQQYYHKMIMTAIPLANFDMKNVEYMQKLYKLNQITKQTNYRLQLYNNVLMEVSNIRNITNPIEKLIELKFNYESFINQTSPGDDRILQALDGALQQGILEKVNTLSELFSAHLDALMIKQEVVKNEDALFEQLKQSLTLFKYFSARDIFEKFYTQRMTRRLLLELHISVELECKILELLKQQCGDQYVRKAEEILMDVNNQSVYQVGQTECRVVLISQNSWTLNITKLPDHFLNNLKDAYIQQNQQQFKQKLILWQQECSTCQLKAFNKYTLQVSVIQAMILMYFNDVSEYQISDLLTKSTVSKDELLKNILPLVGTTLLIRNQDTFILNREFNSKKSIIRINQMQKKESKQEIDETQSRVLNDRKYIIDACIVKIMKRDKKHSMVEILNLVHSELGLPINTSDIKLQVEVLTSKDYLARDPENMSQFAYVA